MYVGFTARQGEELAENSRNGPSWLVLMTKCYLCDRVKEFKRSRACGRIEIPTVFW